MKVVEVAFWVTLMLYLLCSLLLVRSNGTDFSSSSSSPSLNSSTSSIQDDNSSSNTRQSKAKEKQEELIRSERRTNSKSSLNKLPEFSAPIGNITAILGRDVRLVCTVEHLGQYQVAWLKEESKTILSIDTNIITTNYRIFLIPDEEERKWVLHIKDVQGSDRGFYQCQVNTIPVRSSSGYLEVVEPPTIIESQTSQVVEAIEYSNVSILCKTDAHPRATITWRRDDGSPIKLRGGQNSIGINSDAKTNTNFDNDPNISVLNDVKSDKLSLFEVDRTMAGIYVCTASNGISTPVNKRIPLYVKFAPKTSVQNKYVSVSLGEQLEIDCLIEAFPKANSYWSRKSILRKQTVATTTTTTSSKGPINRARWSSNYPLSLSSAPNSAVWLHQIKRSNNSLNELATKQEEHFQTTISNANHQQLPPLQHNSKSTMEQQEHPHNRIQLRQITPSQTVKQSITLMSNNDENDYLFSIPRPSRQYRHSTRLNEVNKADEQNFPANQIENFQFAQPESSSSYAPPKASVSVTQSAINSYTYRLKLTISKMQPEDYGEYSCISSNSIGNSESMIVVTKADRIRYEEPAVGTIGQSSDSDPLKLLSHQQDEMTPLKSPYNYQQGNKRTGSHTVYDENYLQTIKSRQNNLAGSLSGRLEKRLNFRQHSNNGLSRYQVITSIIQLSIVILSFNIVAIYFCSWN